MKLPDRYRYALAAPTSMGVRLTPVGGQPVHASRMFEMRATSAESNILSVASHLGLPVKVLTNFVKGSPIARIIKDDLAARRIDYEGPEVEPGGPWGCRHQMNIADSGYGNRGPRVHNDRSGEVGLSLNARDFSFERIFGEEGAAIVHLSGLNAVLSPETGQFNLEAARAARKFGSRISFDLNYRASFWKGREAELRALFTEIASAADILVGNEEDFQLCLGIRGPEAGGEDLSAKIDVFKEMVERVRGRFPGASVFAATLREVINANDHLWGAVMLEGDRWHVVDPRPIGVLDRIGGGDAFVGGMLYGILKGWEPERWMQFGWAAGALAVTLCTDYCRPADEEQIWSIWRGNARVRR